MKASRKHSEGAIALDRRTLLAAAASLGGASSLAGCSFLDRDADAPTATINGDRARDLAERFAPTLFFDEHEKWFPTDPRAYETQQDGETVVDGFAAVDTYANRASEGDQPPDPTLFYHALEYVDFPLAVVQFWYYSVFDQFTTNFHWHDWEVLHVFVDTDTGDPQLYVASSHSGGVPNNEFLDPDPEGVPRILSELGSHSSALSVNDVADRFQRLPLDGTFADITNSPFEGVDALTDIPIAYGLPRDEGTRLPYLLPELDGTPLYEHERLPSIERTDLIADELTVRSFTALSAPPDGLPDRSTGQVFQHADRDGDADVEYELIPTSELEHITDFTGPQLSFEFAIPQFAEDAIANHITTVGIPWQQPRYSDPAADISDANHRAALADRYDAIAPPAPINTVLASVTQVVTDDDAPDDEGVITQQSPIETVALLESDPEAIPTTQGLAVVRAVPEGEHRLTVNGPGVEPHSEALTVRNEDSGATPAGVDGEIPLVARAAAIKLEVDTDGTEDDLSALAIDDDFAGRLYDAPLSGPDAVYLHRGGAYTTEVRDTAGEIGAFRVNPADERRVRIDEPRTGKGSLAEYIAAVAAETSASVAAVSDEGDDDDGRDQSSEEGPDNAIENLVNALDAVAEAAQRAADRAIAGDRERANNSISTVQDRLDRVLTRLTEAGDDLPDDLERAIDHRLEQARKRSEQARTAEKL